MDQSKGLCLWLSICPLYSKSHESIPKVFPNTPNLKVLWLGELVILCNYVTESSLLLFICYISAWSVEKSMFLSKSMFSIFQWQPMLWFCVVPPFAWITKAKNPLLFNNYLSRLKASFDGSTIATLVCKARNRVT